MACDPLPAHSYVTAGTVLFTPPSHSNSALSEDKASAMTTEALGLDLIASRVVSAGIELRHPEYDSADGRPPPWVEA